MISGSSRPRAAVALALLLAMVLVAPAAWAFHDHADQPESECRVCAVSTVESATVQSGGMIPASGVAGSPAAEEERRVTPPVLESGAARGPPA